MRRPDATAIIQAMMTISDHISAKLEIPIRFPLLHEIPTRSEGKGSPLPSLMTPKQVATILGISEKTLANYRVSGIGGPPHVKNGSRVFYRGQDVVDHIEGGVRTSTSRQPSNARQKKGRAAATTW